MALEHKTIQFRAGEPLEVIDEIERITSAASIGEWITLSPWVDPEMVPPLQLLSRWIAARGPKIPEVSYVPGGDRGTTEVGVLHNRGTRAHDRLRDLGLAPPASWLLVQDHPSRGLVYEVGGIALAAEIVSFALASAGALASVPIDDRWIARISRSTS